MIVIITGVVSVIIIMLLLFLLLFLRVEKQIYDDFTIV